MECNRTSHAKAHRRSGFTLVEFMFVVAIGVMVLGTGLALWAYGSKTCATLFSYVELSNASKTALDTASQQIRSAKKILSCTGTALVFTDLNGGTNSVSYDSGTRKLTITVSNVTKTLMTECTNFSFSAYRRNPISNSLALFPAGTNPVRVVEMRWTAKRRLTGDKDNIETQSSAKVVIRNP